MEMEVLQEPRVDETHSSAQEPWLPSERSRVEPKTGQDPPGSDPERPEAELQLRLLPKTTPLTCPLLHTPTLAHTRLVLHLAVVAAITSSAITNDCLSRGSNPFDTRKDNRGRIR